MATFDPSGAARQLPFRRGAMRVAAYRTFSQTGTQGRAGTPAPTTRVDGCEICRRAYTYRHQRYDTRWLSLYIRFPSSGPRGVEDAAPYGVVFDLSGRLHPPWLHKTPGGEKGKKPKRVDPCRAHRPRCADAPQCGAGLLSFYPFLLPGPCSATLPITSEKPPGTSPGG